MTNLTRHDLQFPSVLLITWILFRILTSDSQFSINHRPYIKQIFFLHGIRPSLNFDSVDFT